MTVKTRIGWDRGSINVVELAKILQDNGAAALAGNFGAAKQHNIRLPAIIQIQADQPLHLGSAECLAECGLRFLAQD